MESKEEKRRNRNLKSKGFKDRLLLKSKIQISTCCEALSVLHNFFTFYSRNFSFSWLFSFFVSREQFLFFHCVIQSVGNMLKERSFFLKLKRGKEKNHKSQTKKKEFRFFLRTFFTFFTFTFSRLFFPTCSRSCSYTMAR